MHKLKEIHGNTGCSLDSRNDINNLLDWAEDSFELNQNARMLPYLFPNQLYWAHLGYAIGSEQAYDRPVLTVDCYKSSSVCIVIPVTLERLSDSRPYHIDLSNGKGTALIEQIRAISKFRIFDYIYDKSKQYATISEEDRTKINEQLGQICTMKPLYKKS